MTVSSIEDYGGQAIANCAWFVDGDVKTNGFYVSTLRLIKDANAASEQ